MQKFLVRKTNFSNILILVCFWAIFVFGCSSYPLVIPTDISPSKSKYKDVGEGIGTAAGFMFLNLISIRQTGKLERAYNAAIDSRNGDFLLEPVIKETWFWTPIGTGFVTSVSGNVIKQVK